MPTTLLAQNQELIKIIVTIIFGIDLRIHLHLHSLLKLNIKKILRITF